MSGVLVRHDGENLKKFILVDVGLEPATPKTHGHADDAICQGVSGGISPFDHLVLQKVNL